MDTKKKKKKRKDDFRFKKVHRFDRDLDRIRKFANEIKG